MLTDTQVVYFHTHGFTLIKNPFGEECMRQIHRADNNSDQEKKLAKQFQ